MVTPESSSTADKDAIPVSESSTQPVLSEATVQVLKAVRIPSRHCRVVQAYIDPRSELLPTIERSHESAQEAVRRYELFFEPVTTGEVGQIPPDGIVGTTCLVSPEDDGYCLLRITTVFP